MLVYANYIVALGNNAPAAVLKAVGAWLKKQMGRGLTPDRLQMDGEHHGVRDRDGQRSYLRIRAEASAEPKLYSWFLSHPDDKARGRQWITEAGLKTRQGVAEFSCSLKTDDSSTLAGSQPVLATCPGVVQFAINNLLQAQGVSFDASVPGLRANSAGCDDDYEALAYEIHRKDRDFPIILVSPNKDSQYLLDPDIFQQSVVGLAQVVKFAPGFNSGDLAKAVGENNSAWSGAINLVSAPYQDGKCRNRLWRSLELDSWGDSASKRATRLFAEVVDRTNIPKLRLQLRPEDVTRTGLRRRLDSAVLSERTVGSQRQKETTKTYEEYISGLEAEHTRLQSELVESQQQVQDLKRERAEQGDTIRALQHNLSRSDTASPAPEGAGDLLRALAADIPPTPDQCMRWLAVFFPDACVILPSAVKSAAEMRVFAGGRRLLSLLLRLVGEYRNQLIEGNAGDSAANSIFGANGYAAKESESTMKNREMRKKRTFTYEGEEVEMFRHLKIGKADNKSQTIRVYFHWDCNRERIVIGYCGSHLPVISH